MAMTYCCAGTGLEDWEQRLAAITDHVAASAPEAPPDAAGTATSSTAASRPTRKVHITFGKELLPEGKEELDGRLLLIIAPRGSSTEPRFSVSTDGLNTAQVFGIDVDGMKPGDAATIDSSVFGAPIHSIASLPPGEYDMQAVFHHYETYNLSTGHTVKLPPVGVLPHADPSKWNSAPGNLYSKVVEMAVGPGLPERVHGTSLKLTEVVPPVEPPTDTDYVKHISIKSALLSEFWGTDIFLGAHVLLPEGFKSHPDAKYPLALFHGHFPADFEGFRPEPPDEDLEPDLATRFALPIPGDPDEKGVVGYNRIQQEEHHAFYKQWTGADFPRFLVVEVQHANPYYDDSYAVNSASMGPWGDAIMHELLPTIESRFRGIGEGWARFTYGGSTGGWEALAVQVLYPDEFNGCFAACPDPIDFRAYCLTDIYNEPNCYYTYTNGFRQVPKPCSRNMLGQVRATLEQANHVELAIGSKTRSAGQFDIWEAVYSPQGNDGYPKRLYDKLTGEIDQSVAEYWRENFDLSYIVERDWDTLREKLNGKLHVYCGTMDNFYLNNAVYMFEARVNAIVTAEGDDVLQDKEVFEFEVDYGERAEHCWNGDQENGNHISRLRYNTMYLDKMMARIAASSPEGADTNSWRSMVAE